MDERGTLKNSEAHPCSGIALDFIRSVSFPDMCVCKEALASSAIEGNRTAEVCLETLNRIESGQPVSDRYLMGLAWMIWKIQKRWGSARAIWILELRTRHRPNDKPRRAYEQ